MSNRPALRDQRLRIMEGVLTWEGEIGNARVRQLFNLQPVQASRLLADFRALMGSRIVEDGRAKVLRYAVPEEAGSLISLEEYVLHSAAAEGGNPSLIDARADLTDVQPIIFATLRKAVISKTGVKISYASMANPRYAERTIFPHAIVHVGRRWHVRAWCAKRQGYRDFTLGRVRSIEAVPEHAPSDIGSDDGWETIVDLGLQAHRKLSVDQQQVVQDEYFGGTSERRLSVRACLVKYLIQDLRVAINPELDKPPEYQIELKNLSEIKKWLFMDIQ